MEWSINLDSVILHANKGINVLTIHLKHTTHYTGILEVEADACNNVHQKYHTNADYYVPQMNMNAQKK